MLSIGSLKKVLSEFDDNEEIVGISALSVATIPMAIKVLKSENVSVQVSVGETKIIPRGDKAFVEFMTPYGEKLGKKYVMYYRVPFWIMLRRDQ